MTSDEDALRALHAAWIDAVNARDLDRLLGWMTDDAVFLGPGQAPLDRAAFQAGFLAGHAQSLIHCVSTLQEVVVVGDIAHARSRDTLSVTPRAGGDTLALAGHRLTVYRRQPDGCWRMARDAHTLAPAAG